MRLNIDKNTTIIAFMTYFSGFMSSYRLCMSANHCVLEVNSDNIHMRKYVANRIRAGIQSRSDFQVSKYPRLLCRDTEKGSENPGIVVSSLET